MDKDLETLINAVAKHLDKLAKRGMYVKCIDVESKRIDSSQFPWKYRRQINVELTTEVPEYAK